MQHKSEVERRAEKEYKNKKHGFSYLLREVISNALHSCVLSQDCAQPRIDLNIFYEEDKTSVEVSDNGEGFTKENYDCFEVLDSLNAKKEDQHFFPKGQGRLAIVYYTDSCEFNSTFLENGSVYIRRFLYPKKDDVGLFDASECSKCNESENPEIKTKISMICTTQQKQLRAKTFFSEHDSAQKIKTWVLSNFMPFFLPCGEVESRGRSNIVLDITFNEETAKISREDLNYFAERIEFSLSLNGEEYPFCLWLLKDSNEGGELQTISCARGLVVAVKPHDLKYDFSAKEKFKVFVTSAYFDDRVSSIGDAVELENEIYEVINGAISANLDAYFAAEIRENREKTKKHFSDYEKELPLFSQFLDPNVLAESSRRILEKKEIEAQACRKKIEEELKYFRGEKSEQTNLVIRSGLAVYVKHRKTILEEFAKLLEQYETNNPCEREVHELICPPGDYYTGTEDYFKHNLWIVDDKFAHFSYTHSAKSGESLPDIAIHAYADNNEQPTEVVFIELKRPLGAHNAGSKDEDMTSQVLRYARTFFSESKGLGQNGGAIDIDTKNCRFFGYILAGRDDIARERRKRREKDGLDLYIKIPFLQDSYFRDLDISPVNQDSDSSSSKKMMRLEMYAYSDLKRLCQNRNKVFFSLLEKPIKR